MPSQLEQLRQYTSVVVDSGDFNSYAKFKDFVQDGTTNPSLLYAASKMGEYQHLMDNAVEYGKKKGNSLEEKVSWAIDRLSVEFGVEILKLVPGRVSTELDARLSFDTDATILRARRLAEIYREVGIDPEKRIYFKIASTWEGIQAARVLEEEGLHCNLTLIFSLAQAVACAEAKVSLVSPFVGRILDFWKKETGKTYSGKEDPGVVSVTQIYNYYKKHGYKTLILGASFRNKDEILCLSGCDCLTISPKFIQELHECDEPIQRCLSPEAAKSADLPTLKVDEKNFRWEHNKDLCASYKLAEGINLFARDTEMLEELVRAKMS
ncbi:transaldolase-like [Schistocerca gregaria]|uniref:transaldolase-like n=1 Tax=Schistocerca gregaria TaxID=7010 RepID=UPI00211DCD56|nr:transaldolase-like [Schistocerca gregaria]